MSRVRARRRIDAAKSRTSDAVARVARFLREHIGDPVRISEVSRIAGMSERGLRNAFRRECGVSPKQYQIRARLFEARRELCEADTLLPTVTDIAMRNGFFELGRFAARYRHAFGERPSDTLGHVHHEVELA